MKEGRGDLPESMSDASKGGANLLHSHSGEDEISNGAQGTDTFSVPPFIFRLRR